MAAKWTLDLLKQAIDLFECIHYFWFMKPPFIDDYQWDYCTEVIKPT